MGGLEFCDIDTDECNGKSFSPSLQECFQLKFDKVNFSHVKKFSDWKAAENQDKNNSNQTIVLEDLSTSVYLIRKRSVEQMRSIKEKQELLNNTEAALAVTAKFDTDLQLVLKPDIFVKLTKMGTLFVTE